MVKKGEIIVMTTILLLLTIRLRCWKNRDYKPAVESSSVNFNNITAANDDHIDDLVVIVDNDDKINIMMKENEYNENNNHIT